MDNDNKVAAMTLAALFYIVGSATGKVAGETSPECESRCANVVFNKIIQKAEGK